MAFVDHRSINLGVFSKQAHTWATAVEADQEAPDFNFVEDYQNTDSFFDAPNRPTCITNNFSKIPKTNLEKSVFNTIRFNRHPILKPKKHDPNNEVVPLTNIIIYMWKELKHKEQETGKKQMYLQKSILNDIFAEEHICNEFIRYYSKYLQSLEDSKISVAKKNLKLKDCKACLVEILTDEQGELKNKQLEFPIKYQKELEEVTARLKRIKQSSEDWQLHTCLEKKWVVDVVRARIERAFSNYSRTGSKFPRGEGHQCIEKAGFKRRKQILRPDKVMCNPMIGEPLVTGFDESKIESDVVCALASLDSEHMTRPDKKSPRNPTPMKHSIHTIVEHLKDCYFVDVTKDQEKMQNKLNQMVQNGQIVKIDDCFQRKLQTEESCKRQRTLERAPVLPMCVEKDIMKQIPEEKLIEIKNEAASILSDEQDFGGFELQTSMDTPLSKTLDNLWKKNPRDPRKALVKLEEMLEPKANEIWETCPLDIVKQKVRDCWKNMTSSVFYNEMRDLVEKPDMIVATLVKARAYYFYDVHNMRNDFVRRLINMELCNQN